jgi:hypothetical protein
MSSPIVDLSFPHRWEAEILSARPLILPPRHFVYPRSAEEVERGALEVLVRPLDAVVKGTGFSPYIQSTGEHKALPAAEELGDLKGHGFSRAVNDIKSTRALAPKGRSSQPSRQPFLATCALGFRDPAVPTGLWSTPNPEEICAASGGYAYILDTTAPERFTMIEYRPVLAIRPIVALGLILFVGHHSILAWGRDSEAWRSEKLSDEGVTVTAIEGAVLHGLGWVMMTDKETPFALDLSTGRVLG